MTITYNLPTNPFTAWFNHSFALAERCSNAGNAYECITPGTSTAAPTGTGANIAPGGQAHFKWLAAIDFASWQAWADAMPATQPDHYIVRIMNNGVLNVTGSDQAVSYFSKNANGFTTMFTCFPGDSLCNHPEAPLTFDPAKGVAVLADTTTTNLIVYSDVANVTWDGIQFKNLNTNPSLTLCLAGDGNHLTNCLVDGYCVPAPGVDEMVYFATGVCNVTNCVFIDRQDSGLGAPARLIKYDTNASGSVTGCIHIAVNGTTTGSALIALGGAGQVVVRDSIFLGYNGTPLHNQNAPGEIVVDHCLTDSSTFDLTGWGYNDAGNNLFLQTAANQVRSLTGDFRSKSGAGSINTGVVDLVRNPSGTDFYRVARGATWDMGPTEFTAQSGNATFAGIGTLVSPAAKLVAGPRATFAGVGSFLTNTTLISSNLKFVTATIAASGNLTAQHRVKLAGVATLAGVGTAVSDTTVKSVASPTTTLTGVGSVTAQAAKIDRQTHAAIAGVGNISVFLSGGQDVIIVADPIVAFSAPPIMPVDRYLDLVPSFNAVQPKFMATLIASIQPAVDLQTFFQGVPDAFDLDTAVGAQLDVDGIWIGRSRFINTPISNVYFSWDTDNLGWEQGTWQGAFDPDDGITSLDDETYRQLLYAKVAANHWNGTVDGIVEVLTELFALQSTEIRVFDNQDMTMTVNVIGTVNNLVFRALLLGGYIPIKPVGVAISYVLDTVIGGQPGVTFIAGVGSVTTVTRARFVATATIAGVGSIITGALPPWALGALLAGVGAITTNTSMRLAGRATPAGVGSVTTIGRLAGRGAATLAGVGSLTLAALSSYTNYVRNPRFEGAVAGTPGTEPTNMFYYDFNSIGITKTIAGSGTDGGIPYIDVTIAGNGGIGGPLEFFVDTNVSGGTTGVALGTTWSFGAWLKIQAGSLTGISFVNLKLEELQDGVYVTEDNLVVVPTTAALSSQFYHNNGVVLSGSGVNELQPIIKLDIDASATINITLRIGAPKLERASTTQAFVILPSVGAIPAQGSGTTILQ